MEIDIEKLRKKLQKQIPRALVEEDANSAGIEWAGGYEFARSGMQNLVDKLEKVLEDCKLKI